MNKQNSNSLRPERLLTRFLYRNNLEPLFIRAGQTDTMLSDDESFHQERDVKQVIRHRRYNPTKLNNIVALLILKNSVTINRHVDITCLADRQNDIEENKCVVSGWDKYCELICHRYTVGKFTDYFQLW